MKKILTLALTGTFIIAFTVWLIWNKDSVSPVVQSENSDSIVQLKSCASPVSSQKKDEYSAESKNNDLDSFYSQMENQAKKILQEYKLAYDEGYIFYVDGSYCEVDGAKPLTDMEEIKKYYPELSIRQNFDDYEFYSFAIDQNITNPFYQTVANPKQKAEQVFKRDISISKARNIIVQYIKEQEILTITISEKSKTPPPMVNEQIEQSGKYEGYTILKGFPGCPDYYYGFNLLSDDKKYIIEVNSGLNISTSDINRILNLPAPVIDEDINTYDGMLKLIDVLNLKTDNQKILNELTFYR